MGNLRAHTDGDFAREEVTLAGRNSGMPLEMLRHELTPVGLHYLLIHFDIPHVPAETWQLEIGGLVGSAYSLSLDALKALPQVTQRVTLECAGNGRAHVSPRYQSMPWQSEAVGTADWTGARLVDVLTRANVDPAAVEIVFYGADHGQDSNGEHDYGRSLSPEHAMSPDILVVHEMNGMPLLPQHGAPVRLIVPGWYGMASVKWLERIEAIDHKFEGPQQTGTYIYREKREDEGIPVRELRVKSLMVPPGFPDFYSRSRLLDAGETQLMGRAWSGNGVGIARVEVSIDGAWQDAELEPVHSRYAWRGWRASWNATPGEHVLQCRATDENGTVQPLEQRWDVQGFGNNAVQTISVTVR